MARIRSIKPDFWGDEKLSPLDPLTRLVFVGLISMADDAGRLVDNLRTIDGFLFPRTEDSSREAIETLAKLHRVTRYTSSSGQALIQVTNWAAHQKIDRPSSKVLPAPSPEDLEKQPIDTLFIPEVRDAIEALSRLLAEDSMKSREGLDELSRDFIDRIMDHGPRIMDRGPGTAASGPAHDAPEDFSPAEHEGQGDILAICSGKLHGFQLETFLKVWARHAELNPELPDAAVFEFSRLRLTMQDCIKLLDNHGQWARDRWSLPGSQAPQLKYWLRDGGFRSPPSWTKRGPDAPPEDQAPSPPRQPTIGNVETFAWRHLNQANFDPARYADGPELARWAAEHPTEFAELLDRTERVVDKKGA